MAVVISLLFEADFGFMIRTVLCIPFGFEEIFPTVFANESSLSPVFIVVVLGQLRFLTELHWAFGALQFDSLVGGLNVPPQMVIVNKSCGQAAIN